jgi:DNA-binding CsgD family transcriptional regulator/PAS domain-containing protein
MEVAEFSELVGLIYDTALDPDAWPIMLNRLADILSTLCGVIRGCDSSIDVTAIKASQSDPDYFRSFTEWWARLNVAWKSSGKLPVSAIMVPEMVMPHHEFWHTDLYSEWCERQEVEAAVATNLSIEGPSSMVQEAHSPDAKGDLDPRATRLFAALIPHLQRAVQLQLRLAGLGGPREGSAGILNQLLQGVLLVDAEARVIFANRAAEDVLRAGRGLFVGRDGLRAQIQSETRRLRRIIGDCAEPQRELGCAPVHLRLTREQGMPLIILVVPHLSPFSRINGVRPQAVLFITDPEATTGMRREWLRKDFGLTPAEAAVATEILKADGLQAAAKRLGVSLTTAHTHLAHIFDKTGTHRQAELVRLLLQSQPAVCEG